YRLLQVKVRLLNTREACNILKISKRTLYKYIKTGKLPCVRLSSKAIRIRETDIMELISERTIIYEPTERTEAVAKKVLEKILSRG
ncbi:MAG: helix-turn-helix domain-containing protein, partial [Thermodesulfovibrionales bacterium]|nr:helix-turn-helix domain-containing protein [Thermodesulfovibrionales bacterium]